MNKLILRLIALFALTTVTASAQLFVSGSLTNGVNLLNANPIAITQLQLTDTSGTNNLVIVYDNDSTTSTNAIVSSWISLAYARATNSTTFTNFAGVVQTNSFVYLSRSSVTNAATTNEATRVWIANVPANGSLTIIPDTAIAVGRGLQVKTSGTTVYNLNYVPLP